MASIIVGIIVFGLLGLIAYRSFFSKKRSGCHTSACSSCPYACDKREI
ncbi:MAG: FeoB-associated Cys-rich membrane protein [Spirochaetales bacterium]|nr:FeoB-associated Cys-rich membrane protein [Spirochaetales bacterium]